MRTFEQGHQLLMGGYNIAITLGSHEVFLQMYSIQSRHHWSWQMLAFWLLSVVNWG